MRELDVLVIGSGVAGSTAAARCAKGGLRTAIVDRLPFGGTCPLRGCDPKRVLLEAAEGVRRFEALEGQGLTGDCRIDWAALMRRKRSFTDPFPADQEASLRGAGVELLHGTARIVGDGEVDIDGEVVRPRHVIIATGARPRELGIPGEELLTTSTEFMELDALPARVLFVGGGYLSFEFAALVRRAGSEATIVDRSARVLDGFDTDLVGMLVERYRSMGVEVVTDAPVLALQRDGAAIAVHTGQGQLVADMVVHGAERVADIEGLGLQAAGVDFDEAGVTVDARLRSVSNPRFHAAGDAAALGLHLTPVASAQGGVVAADILGKDATFDGRATPSVVFSDPPLARVGMGADEGGEGDATNSGDPAGEVELDVRFIDTSKWFTQRRQGHTHGGAKIVTEKASGRLLGAHLLGPQADEVINVFALAIRHGLTADQMKDTIWAYPTAGSDIKYLL